MNKYYIEFKTWREGQVEMPGTYRVLGELNEYRSRANLNNTIDENIVRNTFYSFSDDAVRKFLRDNEIGRAHV